MKIAISEPFEITMDGAPLQFEAGALHVSDGIADFLIAKRPDLVQRVPLDEYEQLEADELAMQSERRGPTLEQYVAAGYKAENYPPKGYPERPSPGLTELRARQAAERLAAETALVDTVPAAETQTESVVEETVAAVSDEGV